MQLALDVGRNFLPLSKKHKPEAPPAKPATLFDHLLDDE
jgi:hypothetical protein